jgi:hypothetical protein
MTALFIAVESLMTAHCGRAEWITVGDIAEAGSWVIDEHPDSFRPLTVRWPAPPPRRNRRRGIRRADGSAWWPRRRIGARIQVSKGAQQC